MGLKVSVALVLIALTTACTSSPQAPATPANNTATKTFVGSAACESCHKDEYTRWKDTLMARVILDPVKNPDSVLGDFSTPNPLVTFKKEDVAFVYGTKWKQRYFTKRGDDYFVLPAH